MLSNETERLKTITEWLNTLLVAEKTSALLQVEEIDQFFELFWNAELARKEGPVVVVVDVMKYLALSRLDAEASLRSASKEGTYLLRQRSSGELVLSVFLGPGCWHGIIDTIPKDVEHPKYFMKGTRKQHESLDALLSFHKTSPFSNTGGARTLNHFLGQQSDA